MATCDSAAFWSGHGLSLLIKTPWAWQPAGLLVWFIILAHLLLFAFTYARVVRQENKYGKRLARKTIPPPEASPAFKFSAFRNLRDLFTAGSDQSTVDSWSQLSLAKPQVTKVEHTNPMQTTLSKFVKAAEGHGSPKWRAYLIWFVQTKVIGLKFYTMEEDMMLNALHGVRSAAAIQLTLMTIAMEVGVQGWDATYLLEDCTGGNAFLWAEEAECMMYFKLKSNFMECVEAKRRQMFRNGDIVGEDIMTFWNAFRVNHPILPVFLHSTSISWSIESMLLLLNTLGTMTVAGLWLVPGAKSPSCTREVTPWDHSADLLIIALVSLAISLLPVRILLFIHKLGKKPTTTIPAVIEKMRQQQNLKDNILLVVAANLLFVYMVLLMTFLANVSSEDQQRWMLVVALALFARWIFLPLVTAAVWVCSSLHLVMCLAVMCKTAEALEQIEDEYSPNHHQKVPPRKAQQEQARRQPEGGDADVHKFAEDMMSSKESSEARLSSAGDSPLPGRASARAPWFGRTKNGEAPQEDPDTRSPSGVSASLDGSPDSLGSQRKSTSDSIRFGENAWSPHVATRVPPIAESMVMSFEAEETPPGGIKSEPASPRDHSLSVLSIVPVPANESDLASKLHKPKYLQPLEVEPAFQKTRYGGWLPRPSSSSS